MMLGLNNIGCNKKKLRLSRSLLTVDRLLSEHPVDEVSVDSFCLIQRSDQDSVCSAFTDYVHRNTIKSISLETSVPTNDESEVSESCWCLVEAMADLEQGCLSNLQHLTLKLRHCDPGVAPLIPWDRGVIGSVRASQGLRELVLNVPFVSTSQMEDLARLLTSDAAPNLTELSLSNMNMTDETLKIFAKHVCHTANQHNSLAQRLAVLSFWRNELAGQSLRHLKCIVTDMRNLSRLDICGNGGLFLDDYRAKDVGRFFDAIAGHDRLDTLLLRACSMSDQDASQLFQALIHNRSIKHLDMDYNHIGVLGLSSLVRSLPRLSTLRVLEMDDLRLESLARQYEESPPTSRRRLTWSNFRQSRQFFGWGESQHEALLQAIDANLSLTHLRLDNRILSVDIQSKRKIEQVGHTNLRLHQLVEAHGMSHVSWQAALERTSALWNTRQRQGSALYLLLLRGIETNSLSPFCKGS